MDLLLKLHLSSYVTRNTQDFSITANVIVLFLLRVMKDVILKLLTHVKVSVRCLFKRCPNQSFSVVIAFSAFVVFTFKGN